MNNYIKLNANGTFTYTRKVPKPLLSYFNKTVFKKALGKDNTKATLSAIKLNDIFLKASELLKASLPITVKEKALQELIEPYTASKATVKTSSQSLEDISIQYLNSLNITASKLSEYSTMLDTIIFIIGNSIVVNEITYKHLDQCKKQLMQLPKRNIQKYRVLSMEELLKSKPKESEKLSNKSINEYLKQLKAVLTFSLHRGLIDNDISTSIKMLPMSNTRGQRSSLSPKEIELTIDALSPSKAVLVEVLYLSGIRLSELYKFNFETIEGVLCFDLTDETLKLKTQSSYRKIPVHSSLLNKLDLIQEALEDITPDNLSRSVSKVINKLNFKDTDKKSLYSLRHSFATELIQANANSNMVSELLGHTHHTMTLTRYAKGFSTKQLQDTIELLNGGE